MLEKIKKKTTYVFLEKQIHCLLTLIFICLKIFSLLLYVCPYAHWWTHSIFSLPSLSLWVSSHRHTNLNTILLLTLRLQPWPLSWALEFTIHYLIFLLGYLISISNRVSSKECSCFPPRGHAPFQHQCQKHQLSPSGSSKKFRNNIWFSLLAHAHTQFISKFC